VNPTALHSRQQRGAVVDNAITPSAPSAPKFSHNTSPIPQTVRLNGVKLKPSPPPKSPERQIRANRLRTQVNNIFMQCKKEGMSESDVFYVGLEMLNAYGSGTPYAKQW